MFMLKPNKSPILLPLDMFAGEALIIIYGNCSIGIKRLDK